LSSVETLRKFLNSQTREGRYEQRGRRGLAKNQDRGRAGEKGRIVFKRVATPRKTPLGELQLGDR